MADRPRAERVLDGLGVSPGVGIGVAHVRETGAIEVPTYAVPAAKIGAERQRLADAVARVRRQVQRLQARTKMMPGAAGEEVGLLLEAHLQMLGDSRLIRGADRRIAENRVNAEAAISVEIAEIGRAFAAMEDAYFASRLDDIREVGNRLVRTLTKAPTKAFSAVKAGSIVLADQLTPGDAAQLNPATVNGCAAVLGGAEGHTAIMARALGIPAVLGVAGLLEAAVPGATVIIDGNVGRVIVDPSPETLGQYERRRDEQARDRRRLGRLKDLPAVTRDGTAATLCANVELPIELESVHQAGAAGIGLLRTEFMFMNRDDIPSEDEQTRDLAQLIEGMDGRMVTVRTLDVGGEKPVAALLGSLDPGAASALGLRGIRLSLARDDVLETQFRAILRAARHGRARILLPMVTTVGEVRRAREVLARAARKLRRRKVPMADRLPPVGVMIEVPGAALAADALSQVSDFFAIGSNDLTMYTLAIDRANEHVAGLFDPLHPAVLRLIQFSGEAAMRAGIPVSICGEVAGDPRFSALLLGLGYRELSMTAASIPRVKQRIRDMDIIAAGRRARLIMDQVDVGRIATLLDDFNGLA